MFGCLTLYCDDFILCSPGEKLIVQSLVQYQVGDEEIGPRHDGGHLIRSMASKSTRGIVR